jgi:excisionase family DNA binding protein
MEPIMHRRNRTESTAATPKLAHSIEEVAELTAQGMGTIFLAIKDRRLRAVKSGRRTLILSKDLAEYLDRLPAAGTLPKAG